ncbi:MAG: hypothetical protein LBB59_03420 [Campylobacteraceae bacterium]|nr:hypothetical protein [Campylobacteraceae bacterium]
MEEVGIMSKNKDKCSVGYYGGCRFPKYKNYDKCILHCEKSKMSFSHHPYFTEPELFYETLVEYILDLIFQPDTRRDFHREDVKDYLVNDSRNNAIEDFLKEYPIVFTEIHFPNTETSSLIYKDYSILFKKLSKIHFNYCHFYVGYLELENIEYFFQDCEFHENWSLQDLPILENVNDVLYQQCIFHKNTSCSNRSLSTTIYYKLKCRQFESCTFKKSLEFYNVIIDKSLFNNYDGFEMNINELVLEDCIINDKLELIKSNIQNAKIENCNFEKTTKFVMSNFNAFKIKQCTFSDFAILDDCKFGIEKEGDIVDFEYVTFLNSANFRNTTFCNGLLFDRTNTKESPNFLGIKIIEPENVEQILNRLRETYRIIKYSFDKIGNTIEANKFYEYEMNKYKQELKVKNKLWYNSQEGFVFAFNSFISNFGQKWHKPFMLIIVALLVRYFSLLLVKNDIISCSTIKICHIVEFLNELVEPLSFLKTISANGMEFVTLICNVFIGICIWHTVIAFKRHTKR